MSSQITAARLAAILGETYAGTREAACNAPKGSEKMWTLMAQAVKLDDAAMAARDAAERETGGRR